MSPVQASIANDDVAMVSGIEPSPGIYYDSSDIIDWTPKVLVENQYDFSADARNIKLEICGGDYTEFANCPTPHIVKEATSQSPNLNRSGVDGDSAIVSFYSFLWFVDSADISTYAGIFTVMFHFEIEDNNPTNDHIRYTISIEDDLIDLVVNDHDVDTTAVYNSNVPIPANLDVQSRSWPSTSNFSTEWSMHLISPLVAESQDCVDWDMNFTGQGNMEGTGELIIHTATHYDATSSVYFSPHDIIVGLTNTSTKLLANIAVAGSEFGVAHNVEVIATWNGSEVYTENWAFTGDGTLQSQTYNTDLENGTLCFTVKMTVSEMQVAQDSHELSDYSGNFASSLIPLPDIVAPFAGDFEVRASVNGSFLDPNGHNDMISFDLTVNDTTDLWIREVVPARGTTTYVLQGGEYLVRYPYGVQSIRVVSGNIGWVTATANVEINLFDMMTNEFAAGPYSCNVTLMPGEEIRCDFDFASTGVYTLNASITTTDGHIDSSTSDNWFEQNIIVDFGAINPTVANPTPGDVYETGQNILAVAAVDPQAPMPLNYTWRMNFMEILGYGPVTNITLPMGEWVLTLYVTDEAGNLEIATQPIRILNRVPLEAMPHLTSGVSISTYSMELIFDEPQLPPAGEFYPSAYNKGKEPLTMFNLSMSSPYGIDISVDSLEAWLDLDYFLPPTINRSTIELLRIPDWSSVVTEELTGGDTYVIHENGTLFMSTVGDIGGSYMIIGELDPVDVNPSNLTVVLQKDGQVMINWENEGDIDNPYFGGWRIYRKDIFRFSFPFDSETQFDSATDGYVVTDVPSETESWQDPNFWEQGTCLSYLVMSHSRAGLTDWRFGNVSNAVWDPNTERMVVDEACVDNSNPETTVEGISASVTFDNVSDIHTVRLTWEWPEIDGEGPLTWNLYRSQIVLSSVTYMDPLVTGLQGSPGEVTWYNESENMLRESIKVEQTYYYILIPFDEVGNSDYLVRQGNAIEVDVDDMFWDYPNNQPPIEGCMDSEADNYVSNAVIDDGTCTYEWDGRLQNDLKSGAFQQAGIVCLALSVLNILMIPMLINKYKQQKVKLKRRRAREGRFSDSDEFADDLEDFFD
ncbi:MAG: hypothetical protein VX473_06950 [Candidatus Thermoplasmatota archaeon]|nr:hypothetical protein [Candidatus Thermoplasmatota archaeon]